MKVAPVVYADLPVSVRSQIKFTFIDNEQWRQAITEISGFYKGIPNSSVNFTSVAQITSGEIKVPVESYFYGSVGTAIITIKATGYEDVAVTVIVQ